MNLKKIIRKSLPLGTFVLFILAEGNAQQQFMATGEDTQARDQLGYCVAISEKYLATSATRDDDKGTNSGSVYIFDRTSGSQIMKIVPEDGQPEDKFGASIDLSGELILIGSTLDDDKAVNAGSAYLYSLTTGELIHKFTAADGGEGDEFGISVALNSSHAYIGAYFHDASGDDSGAVYVFDIVSGNQTKKIIPEDSQPGDQFGVVLDINRSVLAVGASFSDSLGIDSGAAYIYSLDLLEPLKKLTASNGGAGDIFGASIALDSSNVAIGAPFSDREDTDTGSVYIYDLKTFGEKEVVYSNSRINDRMGTSLAMNDGCLLAGSSFHDGIGPDSGVVYVIDTTLAAVVMEVYPDNPKAADLFGWRVALWENQMAVGAIWSDPVGSSSGSAYLIEVNIVKGIKITSGEEVLEIMINASDLEHASLEFSTDLKAWTVVDSSHLEFVGDNAVLKTPHDDAQVYFFRLN